MESRTHRPPDRLSSGAGSESGLVGFWTGSIAVSVASFGVIAVLARTIDAGVLAQMTSVLGVSFIGAILPAAVQNRAALRAGRGDPALPLKSWQVLAMFAALLLGAPVVAGLLGLPLVASALVVMQVGPGILISVRRGERIGVGQLGTVGQSYWIEALIRLVAGSVLGAAFGVTGLAGALLAGTVGSLLWLRTRTTLCSALGRLSIVDGRTGWMVLGALAGMTAAVNLDVLMAPGLLDSSGADMYDVAALPGKGVFIAIMAAGWIVIPRTVGVDGRAGALRLVVKAVAAGLVLAVLAALATPLLPVLLGRDAPSPLLVLTSASAMAIAGGTWVAVQALTARWPGRAWWASAVVVTVLLGATRLVAPTAGALATITLMAQGVGLAVAVGLLARSDTDSAVKKLGPALRRRRPKRERRLSRETRRLWTVSGVLVLANLLQQPGRMVHETKLDVAVDPAGFLARSWSLWEPSAYFGHVQNQAVGYAFPMGPFFLLGRTLGLAPWVVQRLWMATLLVTALWGMSLVMRRLDLGDPTARLLGSLAYALSPIFLGRVGATSAMVAGAALLPWVLYPLIRGSHHGSPRRAAALSGLAVLAIGGVNAAVTAAVLLVPACYLLTRSSGPRRRVLMGWWVLSVGLASVWWMAPLVFQLLFGFNFLPYTERADTTTAFASGLEALRGTADWLAYLNLQEPWLAGAWTLVANPLVVVATALVAATGLYGLCRRDLPERLFLVFSLGLGVVVMTAGYAGAFGAPLAGEVREALGGPAAMFRNVYKFDPVIRFPLALGVTHAVAVVRRRWSANPGVAADVARVVVVAVIVLAALPMLAGRLVSDQGFFAIPAHWQEAVDYLEADEDIGRVLLVPGAEFGDYTWGRTQDEPLQVLSDVPWAVRNLIPLGGAGSTLYLDTIESAIARGGTPEMTDLLRRGGITDVLVRNDLDYERWNAPPPAVVRDAMVAAGLVRTATFGPPLPEATGVDRLVTGSQTDLRLIEIWSVPEAPGLVTVQPVSDVLIVDGSPAAAAPLAAVGAPGRPMVLAGDLASLSDDAIDAFAGSERVVTDTYRRVERDFGLQRDGVSETLAPGADGPRGSGVRDYDLFEGESRAATTDIGGGAVISASSYGSWLLQIPEVAPTAAVDDLAETAWVAGTAAASGEWIQVDFAEPIDPGRIDVQMLYDGPWRPTVGTVTVVTAGGSVVTDLDRTEASQQLAVPAGRTDMVRLVLTAVGGATEGDAAVLAGPGIRDLSIPGFDFDPTLVVPFTPSPAAEEPEAADLVFERLTQPAWSMLRSDEESTFDRTFVVGVDQTYRVGGQVTPRPGPALFELLSGAGPLTAEVSSVWLDLPALRPENLLDGDVTSVWAPAPASVPAVDLPLQPGVEFGAVAATDVGEIAAPAPTSVDPYPSIDLRWGQPREVDRLELEIVDGFSIPLAVEVVIGSESFVVPVGANGVVRFPARTVEELTVTIVEVDPVITDTDFDTRTVLPVTLSEIVVPALADIETAIPTGTSAIDVACDAGIGLVIDGQPLPVSFSTTVDDVLALKSVDITPCDRRGLQLGPGPHRVRADQTSAAFIVDRFVADQGDVLGAVVPEPAVVDVWDQEHREVQVDERDADALLIVAENLNPGWSARLDGTALDPVRVDGWRQAFLVPAGEAGTVELSYEPATAYRAALVLGALAVVALIALALLPGGRRSPAPARPATVSIRTLIVLSVAAMALVLGPLVVLVAVAYEIGRRQRRTLGALAFSLVVSAAVVAGLVVPSLPAAGRGTFGPWSQLLVAAALAVLAASVIIDHGRGAAETSEADLADDL